VLDTHARLGVDARLIHAATPARALVAVGEGAPVARMAALRAAGATVLACPTREGRLDPAALLAQLFEREVRAVLVEGGGETHAAFLDAGLVDRVALFLAPLLLGGRSARDPLEGEGVDAISDALRALTLECDKVAGDVLLSARLREW
jgi:diaminohydroxyphosphoribosylaminopyrimidine deaminase / 5-amino-6-(5-phosphoribosylamino)uracil reductase